jgi:hypothetical protein
MKFDDLLNTLFIAEQDDVPSDANTEVAHPDDFDDVEPMPLPQLPAAGESQGGAGQTSMSLADFVTQLEDFANKLNGTDASSLQSLVSQLDKPLTPFEGIRGRTNSDIETAAKTLRMVSEKLKNFIIAAARK